jgi:hypothetical protein
MEKELALTDGSVIRIQRDEDMSLIMAMEDDIILDQFARRSIKSRFDSHKEALQHAAKEKMFVFALRCYRHSGDSYHVAAAIWDDKLNNPFPKRKPDGSDLPYPYNDQRDSGWAGYVMVPAKRFADSQNPTGRELNKILMDENMRDKALEQARQYVDAYQNGMFRWDRFVNDEFEEGFSGFYSLEDAEADAKNCNKRRLFPEPSATPATPAPVVKDTIIHINIPVG